eukprot:113691_1
MLEAVDMVVALELVALEVVMIALHVASTHAALLAEALVVVASPMLAMGREATFRKPPTSTWDMAGIPMSFDRAGTSRASFASRSCCCGSLSCGGSSWEVQAPRLLIATLASQIGRRSGP